MQRQSNAYKQSGDSAQIEQGIDTPNFRVFSGEAVGYSAPVRGTPELPLAVYAMVSIFNSAFVNFEPVLHMVRETDRAFACDTTITPIFYLNSRKLQEVTEAAMFKVPEGSTRRKNSGPLHNAETKWLDKFEKAESAQRDAGVNVNRHLLAWDDLLGLPTYPPIYSFVQAILLPGEVAEFQDDLISEAIECEALSEQIEAVVNTFVAHNAQKFQKTVVSGTGEVISGTPSQEDYKALRQYLAQEFSVFLGLACLSTLQLMKRAYTKAHVNIAVSISEESPVQPILTYPISASTDGLAAKTFDLFLKIQKLYIAHCERLGLPHLTQPLLVVDTRIPDKEYVKKSKPQVEENVTSSYVVHAAMKQAIAPKKTKDEPPLSNHRNSLHGAPKNYQSIAEMILQSIENSKESGADEVAVYKNGVTCCVQVIKPSDKKSDRSGVLEMIRGAVENGIKVITDDPTVTCAVNFHFNNYFYKLVTKKTDSELTPHYVASATASMKHS